MHLKEVASYFVLLKPGKHFPISKMPCFVFKGEMLQNKGRTSEKINSGGFEEEEDKKKNEEKNGDLQVIAEEPEELLDYANTGTPQGSNQEGIGPPNLTQKRQELTNYRK